jgi:anti-sigma regulatory factor (Ser/Thr protein kinase)
MVDDVAPGTVRIEIPADQRFVALTRVAAASLAADLDPVIDDVEDLRIAVNELVGHLVESSGGSGTVRLELRLDDRTITVSGRTTVPIEGSGPDELTRRILNSTVDGYRTGDGEFTMHKHLDLV